MPSSTSSFKTYRIGRIIPRHHWVLLAWLAFGITLALIFSWEVYCRQMGYAPTLNDTADLWASRRVLVDEDPGRTVLIGSSRMLFDFNMDAFEKAFNERPLQLATVGSNPLIYLEDLAEHPEFSGTILVGVTPGLFFAPGGPPVKNPLSYLKRYREWSPTQRVGHYLGMFLERRLAFLQQEDLTLNQLLLSIKIPNRSKAKVPPRLPPYFYEVDEERQGGMTDIAASEVQLQKRIQKIWIPLFTPPPFPPELNEAEIQAKIDEITEGILERTKKSVEQIRAKGGRVVFIRFPSTGGVRELEKKVSPRKEYWDRILKVTGAPGIHFEDYPELRGFDCPEWSHLSRSDATQFTRQLIPLLQELHLPGKY